MQWNGRSHRYTLAMHIANARTYHNDLMRASQYMPVDIPTEPTRVTRLLNSIETRDQFLISAIVKGKGDEGPNGKANDFELAADYLLKMLPTRSRDNVSSYQVSAMEFDFATETDIPTKGPETGVDIRYHTKEEYSELCHQIKRKNWRQFVQLLERWIKTSERSLPRMMVLTRRRRSLVRKRSWHERSRP